MPRRANADIEEIFRFIKEFIEREQYGPTYSELVKGLGMSRTTLVDRTASWPPRAASSTSRTRSGGLSYRANE